MLHWDCALSSTAFQLSHGPLCRVAPRDVFNQRFREYAGLSANQLCGAQWKSAVHAGDIEQFEIWWQNLWQSQQCGTAEVRLRRFDGECRSFRIGAAPVKDEQGNLIRWCGIGTDEATIVSGGGLFRLKGIAQDPTPRSMIVWLRKELSSVFPFGAPDQRTMFTPERIAFEKLNGALVAERQVPRDSFAGHQMHTPWDPLQRAYFNGYAMWTYLTTPFLLVLGGVRIEETEPWREGEETWRVLRACFPASIGTHNGVQDFFFGEDLMLRRHD